ncbi:MAG: histidinol-phosphate transaminase [Actinobacteria bacterium]|nr:histidinol-phosphate transaminase [Actinomycetota bacterium]
MPDPQPDQKPDQQPLPQARPAVDRLPAYRPGKGAAQAEAEHGITNAIKLASNENPDPPLDEILAAVNAAAAGANRYADHRATALRERIGTWLGVDPAGVTIGAGSVGLLQQLFLTFVDAGDEVVYPWRSFEVYPVYTKLMGGVEVTTPLTADHAFDLEALAAAITPNTRMVLLATPNNPTGTAVRTSDLRTLLGRISPTTVVVIDEAYREFLDPAFGDPVHELVPEFPNVVVTRTFSKAHGLAGIRVGYAVGHPDVIASIDKTLFPFAVNGLAQAAAIAAIDAIDLIQARVDRILAERARVIAALVDAGWSIPDAQANFVYLPLGDRTDAIYLELEKRGVVTRPFSNEGIRVTIGSEEQNTRFLTTLAEVASPG